MPRRPGFPYAVFAFALALAGCSSKPVPPEDPAAANLRKIGQAYELAADLRNRPPRTVEEVRRMFKELGEAGDPDEILRSPRDGRPYVILFGAAFDVDERDTLLAYEKNGAQGARYVLTLAREVKLMNDEEFANASYAKGHKPAKGR